MDSDDSDQDSKSVVSSVASAISSPSGASTGSQKFITGYTPVPWYRFSLRTIVLVILPFLSLAGAFGGFILGGSNGTFESITALVTGEDPSFPGSSALLLKAYTGIGFIDHQLTVLVTFFAPVLDSSYSALMLFSIAGFGQFGGVWTLMVMEGLRMGNKGRAVSFIGTVGFFIQNISFQVTVPVYLLLHLLTSPVAKSFPGTHANSVLLVDSIDLRILPLSVTLSYIVPSLLMTLPPPSIVSFDLHQKYIAFWQPFPVWTVATHWSIRYLCQIVANKISKNSVEKRPPTPLGTSYLSTAKHVYRFIMALCIMSHLPILLITLLPSWIIPDSAPTLAALSRSNFFEVYVPYFPLLSYQVPNLAVGVHTFLQWDLYIGSTAFLLWAILLYWNATTEKAIVDPNTSLPIYRELLLGERLGDRMLWRKLLLKIVAWSLVSGPVGALTILLWERDAIVRQKIKQGI